MKMDELAAFVPPATAQPAPEVLQQLGHITRQLHEALNQLGAMPQLQRAATGLPDARSRLAYIANKTGEAAGKVLDAADQAQAELARMGELSRRRGRCDQRQPGAGRGHRRGGR